MGNQSSRWFALYYLDRLEFNQKTQIFLISQGTDFLGFHYYLTDKWKLRKHVYGNTVFTKGAKAGNFDKIEEKQRRIRMKLKKIAQKSLSMLLATVLMVSGLAINNGIVLRVNAEKGTGSGLSVTAYATPEQLMNSNNFALHEEEGSGVAQKVYFGTNGTQKQTWYIAGSDAADSIVLLCDPELPMAVSTKFEDDSGNNKEYKEEWNCTYGTAPSEVYPNHYGASDLRLTTLKGLETSAFTASEQLMMQSTTIHTMDTKNSSTYSTTDKLYAAYGDSDANYITVGANSAESLNEGIKVSLTSTPYYRKKAFKLRPPYNSPDTVLAMLKDWCGNQHVNMLSSVLPAFRLNLSSVLFASAASAASSDTAMYGVLAEDTAMMLRLDGSSKAIGNVVYNPVKKLLVATKDDGATDPVSFVVQGNDGEKDWYYSKKITDAQSIKASEIKSALGLSSEVDLLNCKFWMETTIDGVTYAKTNYSTATSVSSVVLSITVPVSGMALATEASVLTTGLADTTPAIKWMVDETEVTGNADYDTAHTANITLDTEDSVLYFAENVTATVNGQPATITKNTDGTITVSYTFDATAKGNISYTVTSFEDIYDGQPHGITVSADGLEGVTITYSEDGINYDTTAPTYTNVGEYTVYYKLEKAKYETETGSKTIKINKSPLTIIASDQTITYDKSIDESAYTVTGLAAGDSIENIILTPSTAEITDSGSIAVSMDRIVNAQGVDVTDNYDITCTDGVLIIGNGILSNTAVGYEGVYDGQPHGITVSADGLEGVTITYSEDGGNYSPTNPTYTNVGEYTVYYQLEKPNYETVTGSKTVKITKKPLNIVVTDQNIIYGDSINQTGYTVTGLVDGDRVQTVTLIPGTTDVTDSGSISASMDKVLNTGGVDVTANYDITCTAGNLVISRAAIISTATGYEGVYDRQSHGITVNVTSPADVTITYSTDGSTYNSNAPVYTSVGEYTVYYKIEKPNYETVTGSRTVKIEAVPQTDYAILDGLNQEWVMNSEEAITIRGNGEFADFVGIKVDGVLVDATHYSVHEGSTIVNISNAYLRTLEEGSHTVEMLWINGTATLTFMVINADTGSADNGNTDAGNTDTGNTDTGNTDAGNTDAGNTDAGNTDAGNTDDGSSDTGSTDSENTNTGNTKSAIETVTSNKLDDSPNTGDTTVCIELLIIMFVAGMGVLVTAMKRRKSTKQQNI